MEVSRSPNGQVVEGWVVGSDAEFQKSPGPKGRWSDKAGGLVRALLDIRLAHHCIYALLRAGEGSLPCSPRAADPHALDGPEWRECKVESLARRRRGSRGVPV